MSTPSLTVVLVGWVIAWAVVWLLPIFVAHAIGSPKHRMGSMYGLFLSWLGVLIVALLPPRHGDDTGELQCPDCAEWVREEARICRFCGRELAGRN